MTIDDATRYRAWHATYAAFPGRSEEELRRIFAVVWDAWQTGYVANERLTEQERMNMIRRCCKMIGCNEETGSVVVAAVNAIVKLPNTPDAGR